MARHSHWAQIKLKKGALDKKRGKIFTRHARLIEIAARKAGGDPATNASLRLVMDNARADNMPRENIDRAIKKATGAAAGAEQMREVSYEGYAPGGIALIIDALTDNSNRTNQTIRTIMQKHGGTLGAMGSTSFLFETKGMFKVKARSAARDADELEIIDAGAQDVEDAEPAGETSDAMQSGFIVYTMPSEFGVVRAALEQKGFVIESGELTKIAKNTVAVTDREVAAKILTLIELIEDDDDIVNIAANFDIPEEFLGLA